MIRTDAHHRLPKPSVLHLPLFILLWALSSVSVAEFKGQLTAEAALTRLQEGTITAIDARQPDEYASGHVPGAINVPHDQIEQYLEKISHLKQQPLLIYCRSGRRAAMAEQSLSKLGYSQLYHLQGDMLGWQEQELAVEQ